MTSPLSLLFSRQNNPKSLSHSSRLVFYSLHQLSLLFSEHIPVAQCPSCSERHKSKHSARGEVSTELNLGQSHPRPPGHIISDANQDDINLLVHLCTQMVLVQPPATRHPRSFSAGQLFSMPVLLHGVVMTHIPRTLIMYRTWHLVMLNTI